MAGEQSPQLCILKRMAAWDIGLGKYTYLFLNDEPAEDDKPGEVEECSRVSGEFK